MRNKSLDAVIRGYEKCAELSCSGCPYLRSEDPKLCDPSDKDDDALYYLKEYRDQQNDLEKELAYWRKQNDIVVNLVTILKGQKENILCKECEYYHEDYFLNNIIVAHHVCVKWGKGCITEPEGFCHFAVRKNNEHA